MPFQIVKKEQLSDNMFRVTFHAPLVARRAQPGQFLMFRVDEFGERMPITISYFDREAGDVTVIMQRVGSTTALLASKNEGDYVADYTADAVISEGPDRAMNAYNGFDAKIHV